MIDGELVKSCYQKIMGSKGMDSYSDAFYRILFENYPEVRHLFPENISSLKQHIIDLLDVVTAESCHLDIMHNDFLDLGRRHQSYGATKPMYPAVCETSLLALKEATGNATTDDENQEWLKVHEVMSGIMMSAYN